jgi:hypothetical protein
MELDFDKEINTLLRQAARSGEFVSTAEQNHLDADEISAFAENALPEKTRNVYIKHFAECDRCRKILSNTILLNNEAETEAASSAVTIAVPEIAATKIPWYRKMFLMPNLAYTMGGLVLVFGGMLGFIALQSLNQKSSSDVSQISANAPARSSGPNASDDGISYNSNATVSNATASNSTSTMSNSSSNTAAGATNSAASNSETFSLNKPLVQPSIPAEPQKQDAAKPTDDIMSAEKNESKDVKETELSKNKAAETARNDEVAVGTTKSAAAPPPAPKSAPAQPSTTLRREEMPQAAQEDKKRSRAMSGATNGSRQIGGKTFNRVGGVWIDSAYNRNDSSNMALPPTRTIRRGSSEYQKLDKQVRIIAESLDGAVVIVWKNGAYRIQ